MMLNKALHILLFICLTCINASGQIDDTLKEGRSHFEGLTKTKESFLRDQISLKFNQKFSVKVVEKNVQLIKNIAGIKQTTYRLDTLGQYVEVTYTVEEMNTLVPILNFGSIRGNTWLQLGVTDYNWLGRGQFLSASYQNNNGLHAGKIFYKIPRRYKSVWGYTASVSSWASEEPLYFREATVDYIYQNHSLGLSAIRHLSNVTSIEFGSTAFVEIYDKVQNQPEENLPGPDQLTQEKLLTKGSLLINKINFDYFYREGQLWNLTYQNVYTADEDITFNSVQLEGQYYFRPTKKINIATRIKVGISSNTDSPFAPFVADSHINIRGIGNRISRGTAEAILNVEYRHTISHHNTWASQMVVFTDVGSWRDPAGQISELYTPSQIRQFVGIGSRIIYKKLFGATLRIDYGVDIHHTNDRGLVIGLGQYF